MNGTCHSWRVILIVFALTACAAFDDTVPDEVSCRECSIAMEPIATIGDTTAAGMLTGRPGGVWLDSRGRYWINVLDAFPLIYDPGSAQLVQIGRPGGGPGEFRHPMLQGILPGDSVLVRDFPHFRVIAPDGRVTRTIENPHETDRFTVVRWPDRLLATSSPFDRATRTSRTVIAWYEMTGDRVAVIDTMLVTEPTDGVGGHDVRLMGSTPTDSTIWISDYTTYRLVEYSPSGEPRRTIVRRPEWFPGGEGVRMGGPGQPATPHLVAHWLDDDGLLWVLVSRPREDTGDAWKDFPTASSGGVMEVRVAALPASYELNRTMIEVIDPDAMRVIARHEYDGYITAVLPDNRVASFVETEAGIPILTIHRLVLHGAETSTEDS